MVRVLTVNAGGVAFLPRGKPHAFYIRSPSLRTLILALATDDRPVGLDSYFAGMAETTSSMNLPANAVTYLTDDPSRARAKAALHGLKILSPEEAARALPHYV